MIVYHGTTLENYRQMVSGSTEKPSGAWTVSDRDGLIYVWDVSAEMEEMDIPREIAHLICVQNALESAQVTAAIKGEDTILVVMKIQISNELIQDDLSCEGMGGSKCFYIEDPHKVIGLYKSNFNKWQSPGILKKVINMKYLIKNEINPMLLELVEIIGEVYSEDIPYEKTTKKELLTV